MFPKPSTPIIPQWHSATGSPLEKTKEELERSRANFKQLENEYRRTKSDVDHLHRVCMELDHENRRHKDTIQSLVHESNNMRREVQEYKNLADTRGKALQEMCISPTNKTAPNILDKLGFIVDPQSFNNEHESMSAARAILKMTGAGPVMDVVDTILSLGKEIEKISNFLADNIRHTSYELFQEELDRCYRDSERVVGKRLSKFLREHSDEEELSRPLIKITISIFIVSFCASEWKHYLDQSIALHDEINTTPQRKALFLRDLISVFKIAAWAIPGSAKRATFEESLNPFFESMEETEAAWEKIPESMKVSLSFYSPGEGLATSNMYKENTTKHAIQKPNEPSPSEYIALGTIAFGVHCILRERIQSARPETVLLPIVLREEDIFGVQGEYKPTALSCQNTSQNGDGCDH